MPYRSRNFRKNQILSHDDLKAMDEELLRLGQVSVSGGLTVNNGSKGLALGFKTNSVIRIAKNGASAIAAMSGATPGSGDVTLYRYDGTSLITTGVVVKAKNMHPTGTVTASAWVKLCYVDGHPFVFWEPCA